MLYRIKLWKLSHQNSHSDEQGWVSGFLLCYMQIIQYMEISNKANYLGFVSVHCQLHAG